MRALNTVGITAVVTLACATGASAQQLGMPPALSQTSSYRIKPRTQMCPFGYQTTNVRYSVVGTGALANAQPPHLVLEERATMDRCENQEGGRGEVTVAARAAERPNTPPVWSIRQAGDEGGVWWGEDLGGEAMYRVVRYGCCGAETLSTFYSLRTGHKLFSADHPLLYIEVERVATGYLALHSAMAADGGPGGETDRTQVARISFGGPGRVMQDVLIRGPSNEWYAPRFELVARGPGGRVKRGRLLNINDEIGAGWSVVVAVGLESMGTANPPPRAEILIPLENGRLAIHDARVPAGFRLVLVPRQ